MSRLREHGAVSDERVGPIAECVQALDVQGRTTQGVKTLSSFCSAMLPCEKRKTEERGPLLVAWSSCRETGEQRSRLTNSKKIVLKRLSSSATMFSSVRLLSRRGLAQTRGISRTPFRMCAKDAEAAAAAAAAEDGAADAATEEAGADDAGAGAEDAAATELEELKGEMEEVRKKYLNSLAEMENVRSIARRDVETAKTFAIQGFAKSLLDVADNLNRATESVPSEQLEEGVNADLTALYDGVIMTGNQLEKVFAAAGVEKVRGTKCRASVTK